MAYCTIRLHIMFNILYEPSNSTALLYSFLVKILHSINLFFVQLPENNVKLNRRAL
jgi:hypothetical protein